MDPFKYIVSKEGDEEQMGEDRTTSMIFGLISRLSNELQEKFFSEIGLCEFIIDDEKSKFWKKFTRPKNYDEGKETREVDVYLHSKNDVSVIVENKVWENEVDEEQIREEYDYAKEEIGNIKFLCVSDDYSKPPILKNVESDKKINIIWTSWFDIHFIIDKLKCDSTNSDKAIIEIITDFLNSEGRSLDGVKIDNINFNSNNEDRYQLDEIRTEFGKKLAELWQLDGISKPREEKQTTFTSMHPEKDIEYEWVVAKEPLLNCSYGHMIGLTTKDNELNLLLTAYTNKLANEIEIDGYIGPCHPFDNDLKFVHYRKFIKLDEFLDGIDNKLFDKFIRKLLPEIEALFYETKHIMPHYLNKL